MDLARYKNLIITLALIGVAYLVGKNIYQDFKAKKAELVAQQADLEKKKFNAGVAVTADSEFEAAQKLFTYTSGDDIKKVIENIAQEKRIRIISFKPLLSDKGDYSEMRIELSTVVDYRDLMEFVGALEAAHIDVEQLSIIPGRGQGLQAEFVVRGLAFTFVEKK